MSVFRLLVLLVPGVAAGLSACLAQADSPVPHVVADARMHRSIPGVSAEPIEAGAGLRSAQDLETFIDGIMAVHLNAYHIAGATIAVVKDGKLFFRKGYGYANVEKQIPVDTQQTLFRPGSTSKLFTWTAVMQLVEQGKLNLDADVNTYLTALKIPPTFQQPVTLRNILTHTAGFEDGNVGYLIARSAGGLLPPAQFLSRHMPARVRPPATDFSSGTQASYSNWAAALAGYIVANVSGMSFDEYVEKHILAPLGMAHSSFREPLPPQLAGLMSTGYTYQGGSFTPHVFEYIHNFAPAGGLSSTADDMAKFMIAHLNNGALGDARILKEETARQMHSRLLSPNPYLNGSAYGFYEIYLNGRRLIAHNGGTAYFETDLWLLPDENVGVFVSYNTPSGNARGELMRAFMDRYYPARLPDIRAPAGFAQRAAQYVGSYRSNRNSFTTFEKVLALSGDVNVVATPNKQLLINLGAEPSRWLEVAPDVFRRTDRDQTIAFARDTRGKVSHLLTPAPFGPAYKLAWYEAARFHLWVLGLSVLAFLTAMISASRHWKEDRAASARARWSRRLAATLGAVNLAFLIVLALAFSGDTSQLAFEIPPALRVALMFPLIALPLTIAVAYCAVEVWRARVWSRYGRIQYTLIAVASVAFLWSLNFWNLIGYKFG